MEFLNRVVSVLTSPRAAFAEIVGEPRIEEGVLLAAFYAVLAGLGTMISSAKVTYIIEGVDLPQGFSMGGEGMATLVLLGAIASIFILWFIVAAFVRGISAAFGGRGNYRMMLSASAYSALPLIVTTAIVAVLYYLSSPYTMTTTISGFYSVNIEFSQQYYSDTYLPWVNILNLSGPALCAPLWFGAIREVEGLTFNRTFGALVLLYVIFYGITLGLALLGFGMIS